MIRVVLDANVMVSGLLARQGPPAEILNAWFAGKFHLLVSSAILGEWRRVFKYPRISSRLEKKQLTVLLSFIKTNAEIIHDPPIIKLIIMDPSDNIYLACTEKGNANYLVTGNLVHFQEVGTTFRNARILSPRRFLEILNTI